MLIINPYAFPIILPAPAIAVTSGSGYAGSTYTVTNGGSGKWQADGTDIPGATSSTYTMSAANEGRAISWLRSDGRRSNAIEMWVPSDMVGVIFDDFNPITANVALTSTKVSQITNGGPRGNFIQATAGNQPTYDAAAETVTAGYLSTPATSQVNDFPGFMFAVASAAGNISAVQNWPGAQGVCGFDNGGSYTAGTPLFAGGNVMRCGALWSTPTQAAISSIDVSDGAVFSAYGRSTFDPYQSEISVNGESLKIGTVGERKMVRKTVGQCAAGGGARWQGKVYRVIMADNPVSSSDLARLQGWARWKYGAGLVAGHPYSSAAPKMSQ